MLKRKISNELLKWKSSEKKKCLVIQGARQVGKTYAIKEFGTREYDELVEINFKETPSANEIFAGDLSVQSLLTVLRFRFPDKKMIPGKVLFFFDEIQECPEAITALKFWTIDGRFDVIVSGSLLGIDYKRPSSYPVGYVEYIKMYGLDFEEFLWANNFDEAMIEQLRHYFEATIAVPDAINKRMMVLLREYLAVGGMPEVVDSYIINKDFSQVDKIQKQILLGYQYDIAHYARAEEKVKAEKCYLSLSKQLLDKENHKFQYKEVENGGRAQKFYSSLEWLLAADIIKISNLVSEICYDLDDYARSEIFRVYTTDLSLLIAMKDFGTKQQIIENTLVANTKGGLYECLIADILLKKGKKIFYYRNDTTKKEIDFLIQEQGKIIPIEVKSGNARASSLNWVMREKRGIGLAYKLIDGNIGINENGIITIPLYMAMFL